MFFHFILISILYFICQCNSHSFLIDPKGDFKFIKKPECRVGGPPHAPNDSCPGPCISLESWQHDSKAKPVKTFKRGEKYKMVWTRNNHNGGFVRFSIVPIHQRMNHNAHNMLAFRYACFDSDQSNCNYKPSSFCGTDGRRTVFRTRITIPTIYPDGDYVLGWAWFGGIMRNSSYFGDYWSCTYITIRGGDSETETYPRIFIPGENLPSKWRNTDPSCLSTVDNVGICLEEPCLGREPKYMVPAHFQEGFPSSPISSMWLGHLPTLTPIVTPSTPPSLSVKEVTRTPTPSPSELPPMILTDENPSPSISFDKIIEDISTSPDSSGPSQPSLENSQLPSPSPQSTSTILPSSQSTSPIVIEDLSIINTQNKRIITKRLNRIFKIPQRLFDRLTFVANVSGPAVKVSFHMDNVFLRTERKEPYACFGDRNGVFTPWESPILERNVTIRVSAKGRSELVSSVDFWIVLKERGKA